ncbi:MAG: phage integrase family protein [Sphingomonas bacterium]|uniref:tyrosine-type recombinase/integrase n=1 Tax=Sphingomonas bacterium TaxID=1895847 RepID=UPI00262A8D09|nr:site-specific integrase [Sphingomonas bacterium]MDB5707837.1 phage integrase family protein [Sphingomonas bacterium]
MPRPNTGASLKWNKKRGKHYIVWYVQGREHSRSTGTADIGTAEGELAKFIRDRQDGQRQGPRDPGLVSIAEVLDLYGAQHAPTTQDPERIGFAIDALLPFWGTTMVGHITKGGCERYARQRGRAVATVRRELTALRAAINYAHNDGLIARPVPVTLPEKPDGKDRWLTVNEAARLLNAARTGRSDVRMYLPLFVLIGLYTGARHEAILSLRWPQVDLKGGKINFAREDGKRTKKGRARIPIPRQLATFLKLAKRRAGSDIGFVITDAGRPIKDIGGGWYGDPDKPGNGSFGNACKRAGLDNVTPHTMRHTCGTWMAQKGVSLFHIGGWLGHSDARTTELYAHHHPDYQEEALASINNKRR